MFNATKNFNKNVRVMMLTAGILAIVLVLASFNTFLGLTAKDIKTSIDIKNLSRNLDIDTSMNKLQTLAQNDRVLEVLTIDKNGRILSSINKHELFSDESGVVVYDRDTGLVKYEAQRIVYFEKDKPFEALLNLDDSKDDDEHYHLNTIFSEEYMKNNIYSTVVLSEKGSGNSVLIICTLQKHPVMTASIIFHVLWICFGIFTVIVIALGISDHAKRQGANNRFWGGVGLVPVVGLISYISYGLILAKKVEKG